MSGETGLPCASQIFEEVTVPLWKPTRRKDDGTSGNRRRTRSRSTHWTFATRQQQNKRNGTRQQQQAAPYAARRPLKQRQRLRQAAREA